NEGAARDGCDGMTGPAPAPAPCLSEGPLPAIDISNAPRSSFALAGALVAFRPLEAFSARGERSDVPSGASGYTNMASTNPHGAEPSPEARPPPPAAPAEGKGRVSTTPAHPPAHPDQ